MPPSIVSVIRATGWTKLRNGFPLSLRTPFSPANRRSDVPKICRIRIGEVTLCVSECFPQQRLKRRVAADDTIHGHDGCGRKCRGDIKEVPVSELHGSQEVAARRLLSRGSEIGGRCIDCDRALDATLQQLETQSADAGSDVQ